MRVVCVSFVHMTRTENGKPATTTSTVVVDDDVDKYDIMGEFDGAFDFGWVVSGVRVVKENQKIIRLDPQF